jgi:hypothetical protein
MATTTGTDSHTAKAESGHRLRTWTNWIAALLTAPGAAAVIIFSLADVMATAGCSDRACGQQPGPALFGVLYYGAPVVAVVTIVVSFFTAKLKMGFLVPLTAWALLAADVVVQALSIKH